MEKIKFVFEETKEESSDSTSNDESSQSGSETNSIQTGKVDESSRIDSSQKESHNDEFSLDEKEKYVTYSEARRIILAAILNTTNLEYYSLCGIFAEYDLAGANVIYDYAHNS